MYKYICEVFDDIKAADGDRETIINVIKEHKTKALAIVFMAAYGHPVANLTEEDLPDYNEDEHSQLGATFTTLAKETDKFIYFFKPGKKIDKHRLVRMYLNICEGLHPDEAMIFKNVITKQLYIKGLDYETINLGFGEPFLTEPKGINPDVNRDTTEL